MQRFWEWIDSRAIVRRVILFAVLAMVLWEAKWSMEFATASTRPGLDIAAIIGAITAPLTALMGYVFRNYSESRA